MSKAELMRRLGYGGDAGDFEALLEAEGLSRPGKPNISEEKVPAVAALVARSFFLVCGRGDCREVAAAQRGGRVVAPAADEDHCEVCGGSATGRFIDQMVAACTRRGWERICVVGGSPNARERLEAGVAGRLSLRLVPGDERRTKTHAQADLAWADRVVIWGSTQLDHTVSGHYSGANVSSVARRSIQAVCDELVRLAKGGRKG